MPIQVGHPPEIIIQPGDIVQGINTRKKPVLLISTISGAVMQPDGFHRRARLRPGGRFRINGKLITIIDSSPEPLAHAYDNPML